MGQLYCFSCGKALSDVEQDRAQGAPVPICDGCREAGPQVDPGDVRWMVRRADGPLQGPLSREGVVDRLARELLGPYDQVCRVNAEWQRLVEHPDFRACFIPGTPEQVELDRLKTKIATEKATESARQRKRFLRALALLIIGVVLPVVTTTTGLGVLPERWVSGARGLFGGVLGEAKSVVSKGSGAKPAAEPGVKPAGMPAQNAVSRLRDAYPKVEEPLELLLARGDTALWRGTAQSLAAARDDLERAVASAPDDPEAVAGLAIAYAALLRAERGQIVTVMDLAQRAEALAPGSVTASRARAVAALASGDRKKTAEIATACLGAKPAAAAAAPAAAPAEGAAPAAAPEATPAAEARQDPACAALLAVAEGDQDALGALHERYPEAAPIGLALVWVASEAEDYPTVLKVGRALARRNPEDAAAWSFLSRAALATGQWKEAREAAAAAGKGAPWMLDQRALQAELLLKTERRYAEAADTYEALFADPLWKEYPDKAQVLADGAVAALEAGRLDRAAEWSEASLGLEKTHLEAVLTRARVLAASGKPEQVESVLSAIDNSRLGGREGARYLVGTARLYLAVGQNKLAATALDAALELDPSWSAANLERARVWLESGNPSAAVKQLLALPLLDASLEGARTPLARVWYPEPAWEELRRKLEAGAGTDVRLAADFPAALGVLAWASGAADARSLLKRALDQNPDATAAHAALAWLLLERGEPGAALASIEAVLSDQPQAGLFHALRGRALGELGRAPDAEKAFSQALVNAAKVASVYRWRAELRARSGNRAGAREDLKKALELAPDDLSARVRLAELGA